MTTEQLDQQVAHAKRLIAEGQHEESVTVAVLALVLGVDRDTVYRYVREGTLKAHRFGGPMRPRIRIPCDEVRRFLHGGGSTQVNT